LSKFYDVAVVVGSLRHDSLTGKLADNLIALAPETLQPRRIHIGDLPLYNEDHDGIGMPPQWRAFRETVRSADAVLFVTPEYNRSIPGGLKNAIDVASRPPSESAWYGKPAGIVSGSPGKLGAFGANHHLRQSLVFLNMPTMLQPEVYISGLGTVFTPEGELANEGTRAFLQSYMTAFAGWVALHTPKTAS
jgi:chromate reductase